MGLRVEMKATRAKSVSLSTVEAKKNTRVLYLEVAYFAFRVARVSESV